MGDSVSGKRPVSKTSGLGSTPYTPAIKSRSRAAFIILEYWFIGE